MTPRCVDIDGLQDRRRVRPGRRQGPERDRARGLVEDKQCLGPAVVAVQDIEFFSRRQAYMVEHFLYVTVYREAPKSPARRCYSPSGAMVGADRCTVP